MKIAGRVFTALVALTAAGSAAAADLRARPVYKAPMAAPAASWNGFYVGLGAGARWTETQATVTSIIDSGTNINGAPVSGPEAGLPDQSRQMNATAFRISPYVGYNWQVAPQWLIGIEGDWGIASKTTSIPGMYPSALFTGINTGADTFSVKTTWDASARLRAGYLVSPSWLLYLTGGAAWLHVESTAACGSALSTACFNLAAPIGGLFFTQGIFTHSTTRLGWTIGGGAETMLAPHWIARAEYRYADFGTITNTDTLTFTPAAALIFGINSRTPTYDLRIRTHTATIGIAYKLGD
jgi:outer membrane immunogenic protein